MRAAITIICAGLLWVGKPNACLADEVTVPVERVLAASAEDLTEGRPGEAIRTLEAVADRGTSHPDLSFNRGLGYLHRGKSAFSEPGDFGQAAAGFLETLQFRGDDPEAERGFEEAQLLIAKRKSQANTSAEGLSLGLLERIVLRFHPWVLFVIAALGSLALCIGILLRRSVRESRRLSGSITLLIGALLLLPLCAIAGVRHLLFSQARVAVVIADSVQVVDESGRRIPGRLPLREGTAVYVGPTENGRAPLVSLVGSARIPVAGVRFLEEPDP